MVVSGRRRDDLLPMDRPRRLALFNPLAQPFIPVLRQLIWHVGMDGMGGKDLPVGWLRWLHARDVKEMIYSI